MSIGDDGYQEVRARAQKGLALIEEAVWEVVSKSSAGLSNNDISRMLDLESDQNGKQKNYLVWSVLGRMMKSGKIHRHVQPKGQGSAIHYQATNL